MKPPFSADLEQICTMHGETKNVMEDQNGVQY